MQTYCYFSSIIKTKKKSKIVDIITGWS